MGSGEGVQRQQEVAATGSWQYLPLKPYVGGWNRVEDSGQSAGVFGTGWRIPLRPDARSANSVSNLGWASYLRVGVQLSPHCRKAWAHPPMLWSIIHPHLEPWMRSQLYHVMQRLTHPGIPPYTTCKTRNGRIFLEEVSRGAAEVTEVSRNCNVGMVMLLQWQHEQSTNAISV